MKKGFPLKLFEYILQQVFPICKPSNFYQYFHWWDKIQMFGSIKTCGITVFKKY